MSAPVVYDPGNELIVLRAIAADPEKRRVLVHALSDSDLYQKAIFGADSKTKLYFIAVKLWFFPEPAGKRHSAEVRFYGPKENQLVGETGFTLTLHLEKTATVSDVELFYAQAYKALSCVPDLHNQD